MRPSAGKEGSGKDLFIFHLFSISQHMRLCENDLRCVNQTFFIWTNMKESMKEAVLELFFRKLFSLVLVSLSLDSFHFMELTVSWKESVEEAYERNKLKYADLGAEA